MRSFSGKKSSPNKLAYARGYHAVYKQLKKKAADTGKKFDAKKAKTSAQAAGRAAVAALDA